MEDSRRTLMRLSDRYTKDVIELAITDLNLAIHWFETGQAEIGLAQLRLVIRGLKKALDKSTQL